jgi:hypothetical protein
MLGGKSNHIAQGYSLRQPARSQKEFSRINQPSPAIA